MEFIALWIFGIIACVLLAQHKRRSPVRWGFGGAVFGFWAFLVLVLTPGLSKAGAATVPAQPGAPQRRAFLPQNRQQRGIALLLAGCVGFFIIVGAIVSSSDFSTYSSAFEEGRKAAVVASAAAPASSTPRAHKPAAHPQLGGSVSDFRGKYGSAVRGVGEYGFSPCSGPQYVVRYNLATVDNRVNSIIRQACPPPNGRDTFTQSDALAEAQRFMPPDAVKERSFVADDGSRGYLYRSKSLARTFPKWVFHNCAGESVPLGTFVFILSPEREYWMICTGACP